MAGYGTDEELEAWFEAYGYELPDGSLSLAVLRQRASDYIDGLYGPRFTGAPTDPLSQERAWPRSSATMYGTDIPTDAIPTAVINASYAAAMYEAQVPGGLTVAVNPAQRVKRIKVDVIEKEYFEPAGDASAAAASPALSLVEGLLAPFLGQAEPAIFVV